MPDYQKMYAILCSAIDTVIDPLSEIPLAVPYAHLLQTALLDAEEVYVETAPYLEEQTGGKVIVFRIDRRKSGG